MDQLDEGGRPQGLLALERIEVGLDGAQQPGPLALAVVGVQPTERRPGAQGIQHDASPLALEQEAAREVRPLACDPTPRGRRLAAVEVDVQAGDEGPQALHVGGVVGPALLHVRELGPRAREVVVGQPVGDLRPGAQDRVGPAVVALARLGDEARHAQAERAQFS